MAQDRRSGFTLIELLAVVTIIGVLASIALPRYGLLRNRAFKTASITDLRNLTTAQEAFFSTYGDYAGGIVPGPELPGVGGAGRISMNPSDNVTIVVTRMSSVLAGDGWNAVADHASITDPNNDTCGIFMGDVSFSPNVAVTQAGVAACW